MTRQDLGRLQIILDPDDPVALAEPGRQLGCAVTGTQRYNAVTGDAVSTLYWRMARRHQAERRSGGCFHNCSCSQFMDSGSSSSAIFSRVESLSGPSASNRRRNSTKYRRTE